MARELDGLTEEEQRLAEIMRAHIRRNFPDPSKKESARRKVAELTIR
jgi:hypothetical protein